MIFKVLEDRHGYIWLGTNHGAVRYDGHSFRTYTTRDGLADNTILNMREDREGRLWFVSLSKKLCYFQDGRIHQFHANAELERTLPYGTTDLRFGNDGTMWLIGPGLASVSTFRNGVLTLVDGAADPRMAHANYLISRVKDDWVTIPTRNEGREYRLVRTEEDWQTMTLVQKDGVGSLYHCTRLPNGVVIALTSSQLIAFDTAGVGRVVQTTKHGYLGTGPGVDTRGDLWLSTKSGIYRFRGGNVLGGAPEYYLQGTAITSALRDRAGNYWFSSWDNGLLRMPGIHFSTLSLSSIQTKNTITAIKIYDDKVWFMTSHGNVFVLENDSVPTLIVDGERLLAPSSESIDFMRDTGGRIWLGQRLHVFSMSPTGVDRIRSLPAPATKVTLRLRDGRVMIGTANGIRIFSKGLIDIPPPHAEATKYRERTHALHEDVDGSVWLGAISGLYRYERTGIRYFGNDHPLLRNRINAIARMPSGTLLLGTWGAGLLVMQGKRVRRIDADSGLASDFVRSIHVANDSTIWIGTNRGLSRLVIRDEWGPDYDIVNYTTAKGLPSNGINGIVQHRGLIWLATDDGLCRFHPDSVGRNLLPLPVEITDVAINGESIASDSTESIRDLPHDRNNVTVSFIGIGFRTFGDIRYRYRLLGLGSDTAWHETVNRTIPFFSLPAGAYTFQVSAMNEDGVWNSAPREIRFTISRHFSQTLWFRAGGVVLTLLCVGLIAWRIADNRRRAYAIDAQIRELRQQALSANMNPHFISNALSAVQDYVLRHDAYEANEFLARFSRLIRLNLETSLSSFVSLEEELERLEIYLSLEKLRFGDDLDYRIAVEEGIDADETLVPSMLVQPYVENAIWHGILPAGRPGVVEVEVSAVNPHVYTITIRDNGIGISTARKNSPSDRKSLSMSLNRERLSLLSRSLKRSFTIIASDRFDDAGAIVGTVVTITLPRDVRAG